jgi:hypothetical protein
MIRTPIDVWQRVRSALFVAMLVFISACGSVSADDSKIKSCQQIDSAYKQWFGERNNIRQEVIDDLTERKPPPEMPLPGLVQSRFNKIVITSQNRTPDFRRDVLLPLTLTIPDEKLQPYVEEWGRSDSDVPDAKRVLGGLCSDLVEDFLGDPVVDPLEWYGWEPE